MEQAPSEIILKELQKLLTQSVAENKAMYSKEMEDLRNNRAYLVSEIESLKGILHELAETISRFWFYDRREIEELLHIGPSHSWMKEIRALKPDIKRPNGPELYRREKVLSIIEQYDPILADKLQIPNRFQQRQRKWLRWLDSAMSGHIKHSVNR